MSRANPHFDIDFSYGSARENAVSKIFLLGKVEVKSDRQAVRTGNVFIELEQGHGGSSGIRVTTADHWIIETSRGHWVLIEVGRLKALVNIALKALHGCGRACRCGCGNKGVVIPVTWLALPWLACEALGNPFSDLESVD